HRAADAADVAWVRLDDARRHSGLGEKISRGETGRPSADHKDFRVFQRPAPTHSETRSGARRGVVPALVETLGGSAEQRISLIAEEFSPTRQISRIYGLASAVG